MGRKIGGLEVSLVRRVESCKSRYSTVEEIIEHLRSTYPEYERTKSQTLNRLVNKALLYSTNENGKNGGGLCASRKRQKVEGDLQNMSGPSISSSSNGGNDGAVSEETNVDLMKTMLRNSYKKIEVVEANSAKIEEVEANSAVKIEEVELEANLASSKGPGLFKDFGGMNEIINELKMDLMLLYHPKLPRHLGVRPITGILLYGPPGCGKTRLAHAIANETGFNFYPISSTQFVSGASGESEEKIRDLFSKAKKTAPSIIFIDEIDAIASKRDDLQREMDKRIVTQLITCMDEPDSDDSDSSGYVLVIGATNRIDAIDRALRRPGRFDCEICLPIPDESAREEILCALARTKKLKLDATVDLQKIARTTPGFVAADLVALADKAGRMAIKRMKHELSQDLTSELAEDFWKEDLSSEELNKLAIKMSDFQEATKIVQPSTKREGFSEIPDKKWEDIGGLDHLKREFDMYIIWRIKYPEKYEGLGMNLETGFLLYGPPGCGKTHIAKAVANEAGANFIHIKGPELLNKYVGESELRVRKYFSDARACAPCILFFDEVDALTKERDREGGRVIEGVLNQLLIELDGAEQRKGVFVIGATNRPDVMDRAMLRPGRFGKLLYVPLPNQSDRILILKALTRELPIDPNVDLSAIARMKECENLSGADLKLLVGEAQKAALEEKLTSTKETPGRLVINSTHFEVALSQVSPSVSKMQRQHYESLSKTLKAT